MAEELLNKLKAWQKNWTRPSAGISTFGRTESINWKRKSPTRSVEAEKFGYRNHQIKDASGKVLYEAPAIEELIRWRLWDRTGAGLIAELGGHQLDAAGLFIAAAHDGKKQIPLTVAASAERPLFPPDRDVRTTIFTASWNSLPRDTMPRIP